MKRVNHSGKKFIGLITVLVVVIAALDQITKQFVLSILSVGQPLPIIGDWFRFYLLFNPGAAFSLGGAGSTWLFTSIQLAFVVGVAVAAPRIHDRWQAVGLAMIAGGALGNLGDRLFRAPGFWFGHVVDFISVGNFAVFNLADSSITVGVVVFIIAMLAAERRENAGGGEA